MAKILSKFKICMKVDYVKVTNKFFKVLLTSKRLEKISDKGNSYYTYMGYRVIIDDTSEDDIEIVFTQSMKEGGALIDNK